MSGCLIVSSSEKEKVLRVLDIESWNELASFAGTDNNHHCEVDPPSCFFFLLHLFFVTIPPNLQYILFFLADGSNEYICKYLESLNKVLVIGRGNQIKLLGPSDVQGTFCWELQFLSLLQLHCHQLLLYLRHLPLPPPPLLLPWFQFLLLLPFQLIHQTRM